MSLNIVLSITHSTTADPEVRPLGVRLFWIVTPTHESDRVDRKVQPNSSLFSYDSAPSLFIQWDFKFVWCA
jgi:hypothetical protein